jgi:CheY-like chemotaxis protein
LILADPTQIHQILMNLCANSFHSMRDHGGTLDIKLDKASLDADFFERHPHVSPGRHVRLSVRDTGSGIAADSIHRIFEPYFTTKPAGEGTGLGLSVVHGIVKSCGGAIEVHSEPGEGTLFELYFPVFGDREERREEPGEQPVSAGSERILLVDDELAIVQLGQQLLEGMGYEVVTRTSSVEALELFKVKPDLFDLIITDMTMPNMTGIELTREIRRLRPDVPVILCTGFSELISEDGIRPLGIHEVVMKPVLKNELAAAIRRAIDT